MCVDRYDGYWVGEGDDGAVVSGYVVDNRERWAAGSVGRLGNGTGLAGVRRSTISGMENDEVFFFFPWIWGSGQDDFEIRV